MHSVFFLILVQTMNLFLISVLSFGWFNFDAQQIQNFLLIIFFDALLRIYFWSFKCDLSQIEERRRVFNNNCTTYSSDISEI
jgi:hypothetical protein